MKTRTLIMAAGVLFSVISVSLPAKVIIFPINFHSHVFYHAKIGRLLADEGHVVDMLLASHVKVPEVLVGSDVGVLQYELAADQQEEKTRATSQMLLDIALTDGALKKIVKNLAMMRYSLSIFDDQCAYLLGDGHIRRRLASSTYDVAIVDALALPCFGSLMRDEATRLVILGRLAMEWQFRVPVLPSFVPTPFWTYDDAMTFPERLLNAVTYVASQFVVSSPARVGSPERPVHVGDTFRRHSLFFDLDDVSVAYPKPTMPHVVSVGDAIPDQGKPLPDDLAQFVEGARHGVIVVSFGSYFDRLPPHTIDKFCSVFADVPQKVIWKLGNKTLCDADPAKLLLLDWLPQNDLLSHENVKLFISHCGINGILESIYHSTPILGFPIAIDQPYNARRLESRGFGYQMSLIDFSTEELSFKISAILSDENILRSVKRASFLLRNKPDTPAKRISYWVQHLATYGDKHLKSHSFELNTVQFYCLDILLVIFIVIIIIFVISFYCMKSFICCLRDHCFSKKDKKD